MPHKTSRRRFLKATAFTGIGFWVVRSAGGQPVKSPNDRIQFAAVGIGGKGSSDSADAARHGDVVAICDVDHKRLATAAKNKFPEAKTYTDFRKLLEENEQRIDAVTVSTPDHTHAPPALMAMRMGKHCFCQKPLTHSIYEAWLMAQVAREKEVATEMGNQGTARSDLREGAALMKAGVLGTVTEVHVWTNRPIWPQGQDRPPSKPVPEGLDWECWIGPAPFRDYHDQLHPFAWRGWWDFGTGALGDMACHTMNLPFAGLDLRDPVSVQAETSGHNKDSYPKWSIITYEFPERNGRPALKMIWYDGGKKVDPELLEGEPLSGSGCLVIGTKGKLFSGNDYGGNYKLLAGAEKVEVEYEKSPGHFEEWVRAIQEGKPAMSNFPDYAAPLTQTVLLGNLAVWVADQPGMGPKVEWDAENLKVTNIEGLEPIIKPTYREGYVLDA
ncbi:MAG TPA: Gfo/Idh/MocA family oxidoreductase [Planctomycetaceae bacterium]|nr:Gfo/Idh/MocA family oxidoreductase [Planctomycetaceae bacterium]